MKVSKPGQDLRFDVPAVGVDTIDNLHRAGGAVLAIEAGKTILLGKRRAVANCGVAGNRNRGDQRKYAGGGADS